MRCRTTVCFSLLMFFAGQSAGATTGGTVSEIEMALANANTDYLRMQGDRDAARALPARAAYFRTKGEISNSDKWASRCIEDAIVLAQPGSNALYQCLGILAGNRLWLGDIRGWAETMIKVRRLGASQPSLRASALYQEANIDGMQFEAFLDRPASSVTNVPKGIVEVPVKHLRDWPVISAKITGGGDGAKRDVNVEFLVPERHGPFSHPGLLVPSDWKLHRDLSMSSAVEASHAPRWSIRSRSLSAGSSCVISRSRRATA